MRSRGFQGVDIVLAVKLLGIACAVGMTVGLYELLRSYEAGAGAALLAGVLAALTPLIAFSQVAGMEVCLAAGFGLWALCALQRARYWISGLLLAAAVWGRPEMLTLWALTILVVLAAWQRRVLSDKRGALLGLVVPTCVAAALWCGYCLAVTGHPLPNTFYAKFDRGYAAGFLVMLREIVWVLPANFLAAGTFLLAVGSIVLLRRGGPWRGITLLFPWLFLLGIAFTRRIPPNSGGYYYWARYVVPVVPFLFVPLGMGWNWLWQAAHSPTALRLRGVLLTPQRAVGLLLAGLCLAGYPGPLAAARQQYAWNCQNINEVQVALGRWVAASAAPGAAVLVNDAGAIRYFGGHRTIDLIGLNSHEVLFDAAQQRAILTSPERMRAYMREQRAEYLIVFPSWLADFVDFGLERHIFREVKTVHSERYTIVWPNSGQDWVVVLACY